MPKFRIYTDEKITVWQRVGLVIDAENENDAQAILADPARFNEVMYNGGGEYNGDVNPYWESEDHAEWDHDNFELTLIGG